MRTVCCWSGGKDSTATIIVAHELGMQIDEIICAEVMFDKKRGISGENPEHIRFMKEKAIPLFVSWGYKVTILRSDVNYLDVFHTRIKNARIHKEHEGMKRGFPLPACSIRRDCKLKPVNEYLKTLGSDVIQYVGICIDEPLRLKSMHLDKNKASLLELQGYTEQMARDKCLEYDLLSPTYEYSNRGGCWMCPFAKEAEHRAIRQLEPRAWYEFVALEDETDLAVPVWNIYSKTTLREREVKFQLEDKALGIPIPLCQYNN